MLSNRFIDRAFARNLESPDRFGFDREIAADDRKHGLNQKFGGDCFSATPLRAGDDFGKHPLGRRLVLVGHSEISGGCFAPPTGGRPAKAVKPTGGASIGSGQAEAAA